MVQEPAGDLVLLAIPNEGWLRTDLYYRIAEWSERSVLYAPQGLKPVAYAKNVCMEACLKRSEFTHIFFVDSDTVPPPWALDVLLAADVPVISGVTHQMKRDLDGIDKPVPMVCRESKEGLRPVLKGCAVEAIDACGASCLLIRRDVIETIEPPWFITTDWPIGSPSSDFKFCERLRYAEIPIYAHFSVICAHFKEVQI